MQDKRDFLRKGIKVGYLILIGCMFVMLLLIKFGRDDRNVNNAGIPTEQVSEGWTLDQNGNETVDLSKLGSYMDEDKGQISIYYRLPKMVRDISFVYRTKDIRTKVVLDGNTRYETKVAQSPYYNRSPGNLWNVVTLHPEDSGKILEMQVFITYDTKAVALDNLYFGDAAVIIISLIRDKIGAVIVSALMFLIGFCMIVVNMVSQRNQKSKNNGLLYLGIYASLIGIWSMIETNVLQFFVRDMRILQLMDNMIMIVGVMPLLLYLDCQYHLLDYFFMKCFFLLDLLYIFISVVMQFSGIMDLHKLLPFAQIFTVAGSVIVLIWIIIEFRNEKKNHHINASLTLKIAGIVSLLILSSSGVIRYQKADVADRAESIRFGMLTFIICFCISELYSTYQLIKYGLKYDLVRNLAYTDGLTGLGNRTAYLEQLDQYAKENVSRLGIVFMDINNLKVVNDTYGHDLGDELIKEAADIIRDSFGKAGKAYRIGGDEFCVLITCIDMKGTYEELLLLFQQLIQKNNETNKYNLNVQIAQGFACCEDATMERIEEAVSKADIAMYSDKERQKKCS